MCRPRLSDSQILAPSAVPLSHSAGVENGTLQEKPKRSLWILRCLFSPRNCLAVQFQNLLKDSFPSFCGLETNRYRSKEKERPRPRPRRRPLPHPHPRPRAPKSSPAALCPSSAAPLAQARPCPPPVPTGKMDAAVNRLMWSVPKEERKTAEPALVVPVPVS